MLSPDERFFEEVGEDGLTQHQRECLKDANRFNRLVDAETEHLFARCPQLAKGRKPFLTAQDIIFLREMKVGL